MARGIDDYDDDNIRVKTILKSMNYGRTARLASEGDCYEYVTLECHLLTVNALQSVPATIHLQVAFDNNDIYDQNKIVLKMNAIIVTADPNISGAYQGFEVGHDAVAAMKNRSDVVSIDQAISVWLKDSYVALVGLNSDNVDTAQYVYCLKQLKLRKGIMLEFEWKKKLLPFGIIVLGSVLLLKMNPVEIVNHSSTWFIQPLINSQLVERKRQKEADRAASSNMENLLEDNVRLLNTLQLVNKTKELNDQQQMVQFLKVLNAKKQKLAALKQDISELKQQLSHNMPISVIKMEEKESKSVKNQQPSYKVDCDRNKHKMSSTVVDEMTMKKKRLEPTQAVENIQVDDNIFEADTQIDLVEDLNQVDSPSWFQEPMELSEENQRKPERQLIKEVPNAMITPPLEEQSSQKFVNVLDDDNTKIDAIEDNTGSPLLLQKEFPIRPMTTKESSLLLQSSPNKVNDQQEPSELNVFKKLWSGIA